MWVRVTDTSTSVWTSEAIGCRSDTEAVSTAITGLTRLSLSIVELVLSTGDTWHTLHDTLGNFVELVSMLTVVTDRGIISTLGTEFVIASETSVIQLLTESWSTFASMVLGQNVLVEAFETSDGVEGTSLTSWVTVQFG